MIPSRSASHDASITLWPTPTVTQDDCAVGGLDQHPRDRVGAVALVEDPDLVVDELELRDRRIGPDERLPQSLVEGVHGAVPLAGLDVAHARRDQLHRRLRDGLLPRRRVGEGLGDHAPRLDGEVGRPGSVDLGREQQLERRVGCLERVAARLHLLDLGRDAVDQVAVARQVVAELATLQLDRGTAGHVADEQPHVVAHTDRIHVLVEVRVHLDRARVQPGLVREGRRTDVGLARGGRHVRHLGHRVGDPGGVAEQTLRQHPPVQLQLEVGHDGHEVGVAGPLAVPVDGALHVRRAGLDGGQCVGDRAAGVVVAVDADAALGRRHHVVHDVADPAREHPSVGVAERDDLGPGVVRRPQHLERVVTVGAVAVEEVLGVEEDLLTLGGQVAHRVADHLEVLGQRRSQGQLDVPWMRLRHEGDHRGATVAQRADQRVVRSPYAGPPGGAEGGEPRVAEVELGARAGEELGVLGVGPGPTPLDEPDAQLVELARDRQLVGHGEVQPLLLRAVAQGGVVDVERALQVHRVRPGARAVGRRCSGETKRPPVGTGGLRVRVCPTR